MSNLSKSPEDIAGNANHPGYSTAVEINQWMQSKRAEGRTITVTGEENIQHTFEGISCGRKNSDIEWVTVTYSKGGRRFGAEIEANKLPRILSAINRKGSYVTRDMDEEPLAIKMIAVGKAPAAKRAASIYEGV